MKSIAEKISATGRTPGIWLAPFIVAKNSQLAQEHPDWLLRDAHGNPVPAGITWSGHPLALDVTHPEVLGWLDHTRVAGARPDAAALDRAVRDRHLP